MSWTGAACNQCGEGREGGGGGGGREGDGERGSESDKQE